eukprot:CAMPEP_0113607912 /NCGR_PEP_ID=MMETSP0017_2-20120614/3641_1 /TAXON_ID=2856 /ORGANISM="Cylindrotheca closterium" /LENGTH=61 /DNA_ID=CAMNT_0000516555 /DNA_START=101 /DNA_END=286 /DNA_ORIENTATION=- /assembly_acc=CAM_ASM_000147
MVACVVGGVATACGCKKKDGKPIIATCSGGECSYQPKSQQMAERSDNTMATNQSNYTDTKT